MKIQLKRPKQRFLFPTKKFHTSETHLRIFPIFKIEKDKVQTDQNELKSIQSTIEKHEALGDFQASLGQILILPSQGVILGGLGKRQAFHPEKACQLFRLLGAKLASFKNISVELIFTDEFIQALEEHTQKEENSDQTDYFPLSDYSPLSKRKAKIKQNAVPEEEEALNDYIAALSPGDLIMQLVACLNLGAEPMELLKTKKKPKPAIHAKLSVPSISHILTSDSLVVGKNVSEMLHGARYIASLPGNYLNPERYENYAVSLAKEFNLKAKVFGALALKRMGCGGILAVGQGSAIAPRMIALEYQPKKASTKKPIVLVGKGITFDTGGISIKPSSEMHEMKYDMCGSALALHSIALASANQLSVPVIALLGIAENMPDGQAIKPGDVYTAYNGSTVEVQNTDAEGRLVLGDLLAYACSKYDPLCLLDFATLTGACIVALGHHAAAVMTDSEELYAFIHKASHRSLERIWRMPHWSAYGTELKSEVADQRNIAGRAAGTISAMRFLAAFVPEHIYWAHFDIAGTAWRQKDFASQGKGATGWGIRLLGALMESFQ